MSDYVAEELVKEILLKVPPKHLLKCMSVCKSWHSIITSPSFISTHLSRALSSSPPRSLLLCYFTKQPTTLFYSLNFEPRNPHPSPKPLPSPFKPDHNNFIRIVGSLHGLLCLTVKPGRIMLWNPSINRYVWLPNSNYGPGEEGFGFDSKNDDYKVVTMSSTEGNFQGGYNIRRVEVYSLKGKSWREIKFSGVDHFYCAREFSKCFMNSCVHWVAMEVRLDRCVPFILMFDVCDERFMRMEMPENLVRLNPRRIQFAEIGGSLAVLNYHSLGNPRENCDDIYDIDWCCDVWVMKQYGDAKSWTKLYRISVEGGVELIFCWGAPSEFLVGTQNGNLISYNVGSQEKMDLDVQLEQGILESWCAQNYIESLILLDEESLAVPYGSTKEDHDEQKGSSRKGDGASVLVLENDNAEPESRSERSTY